MATIFHDCNQISPAGASPQNVDDVFVAAKMDEDFDFRGQIFVLCVGWAMF